MMQFVNYDNSIVSENVKKNPFKALSYFIKRNFSDSNAMVANI